MARRNRTIVPGKAEMFGGGLVLVVVATVSLVRGGPEMSRADEQWTHDGARENVQAKDERVDRANGRGDNSDIKD